MISFATIDEMPLKLHTTLMAYKLGDVFIGQHPISQNFGARPDVYYARYKLSGHNGTDFACPSLTPVLAAADGWVSESGFDAGGYGNYVKIVHDGYLTIYAHLNDILVQFNDKVVAGEIIGHSNNTGFSDAPHLHFGVAPCDKNGIKTEAGNGYSGYIDPMGSRCDWDIKNLTEPVVPGLDQKPDVPVPASKFSELVTKSTNWDVVCAYFKLSDIEKIDPKEGEEVVKKIVLIEHDKQETERVFEEYKKEHPITTDTPNPDPEPQENEDDSPTQPENPGILFMKLSDIFKKLAGYWPFK